MSATSSFPAATRRSPDLDAISPARLRTALGAIAFAALLMQLHLGTHCDSLWMMICAERWLDGQVAYRDFLENSPPLAILIYVPPVALARALNVGREPMLAVYGVAVVAACLALCAAALRRTQQIAVFNAPIMIAATTLLLLIPDYIFAQRDHFALALSLPFLTIAALRADGAAPSRWSAIVAGCAIAVTCAIRPHYLLALAPTVAYVAYRRGLAALFGCVEIYAAVVAAIAIALASLAFFPHYFDTMLPLIMTTYVADHDPLLALSIKPTVASWAILAAAFLIWRSKNTSAFADVAAIASTGGQIAYFVQAKGFPYQDYFADALMFMAVAFLAGRDLKRLAFWLAAPIAAIVATLAAFTDDTVGSKITISLVVGLLIAAAALTIYAATASSRHPTRPFAQTLTTTLACGALGLMLFAFHAGWRLPMFEAEARALGPHPTIALISDLNGLSLPLISRVDGQSPHRVIDLLLTSHADRILQAGAADATTHAKLTAIKQLDLEMFLADVARTPPDAVVVEEGWAAKHFHSPEVAAWLAGYRRAASVMLNRDNGPDPIGFYVRSTAPAS